MDLWNSLLTSSAETKAETSLSVTYSGCLGDRYTDLGAQTLAPKKHLSSFLFRIVFQ